MDQIAYILVNSDNPEMAFARTWELTFDILINKHFPLFYGQSTYPPLMYAPPKK